MIPFPAAVLFLIAWGATAVAAIFSLVEQVAAWRFLPWAYRIGPRVLRTQLSFDLAPLAAAKGSILDTETGRFKVTQPSECLFRLREPVFKLMVRTTFSVRGAIRWQGREAQVEGRLALGTVLVSCTWLAAVTVLGVIALLYDGAGFGVGGLTIIAVGWLFMGGLSWVSFRYELKRAQRILSELQTALANAAV